jgi:hypothetical protein
MTAHIKVIHNPQAEASFSLRFSNHGKDLFVKIIINKIDELNNMTVDMKNILPVFGYTLNFNWKGCPQAQNNHTFKNTMHQIFSSQKPSIPTIMTTVESTDIESLSKVVQSYVGDYGSSPDFSKIHTIKGQRKIHNYLKNILARPHLSLTDALLIAKRLAEQK